MLGDSSEIRYLSSITDIYSDSELTYFGDGSDFFVSVKHSLLAAKHFIFMEFFTLRSGFMLNDIIRILEKKAREGVKIYVLCDNIGSFHRISLADMRRFRRAGIHIRFSMPIRSRWIRYVNNRDHTKIIIVDGYVAYTGGYNIADIYNNIDQTYGYWKDAGVKVTGPAVRGLTDIFLKMWNFQSPTTLSVSYSQDIERPKISEAPLCIPFLCKPRPLEPERVAKSAYLNMIYSAREYLYLATPYLACDSELENALCLAAKRGIDVHVIIPGHPDHPLTFYVGRDTTRRLIRAGVHIYSYLPGMIHMKCITRDHESAIIGSINLDYRSMDIDFEIGCFSNDHKFIKQVENDLISTITESEILTEKDCKTHRFLTILGKIFKKQM